MTGRGTGGTDSIGHVQCHRIIGNNGALSRWLRMYVLRVTGKHIHHRKESKGHPILKMCVYMEEQTLKGYLSSVATSIFAGGEELSLFRFYILKWLHFLSNNYEYF